VKHPGWDATHAELFVVPIDGGSRKQLKDAYGRAPRGPSPRDPTSDWVLEGCGMELTVTYLDPRTGTPPTQNK
jgi:hypothetical protein